MSDLFRGTQIVEAGIRIEKNGRIFYENNYHSVLHQC